MTKKCNGRSAGSGPFAGTVPHGDKRITPPGRTGNNESARALRKQAGGAQEAREGEGPGRLRARPDEMEGQGQTTAAD